MLLNKDGNDTLAAGGNVVCYRCHNPSDANNAFPEHDKGNHIDDSLNLYNISCLSCHGGGIVGGTEWGTIHGIDDGTPLPHVPYVFTYGAALGNVDDWTPLGTASCGSISSVSILNDCTNHSNQGSTGQSYDRLFDRTYP